MLQAKPQSKGTKIQLCVLGSLRETFYLYYV
jgi:hypothetical protein